MGNASNKQLGKIVSNVLARQCLAGREPNKVQRVVMVRLQNAVAIEESCEALRNAEAK